MVFVVYHAPQEDSRQEASGHRYVAGVVACRRLTPYNPTMGLRKTNPDDPPIFICDRVRSTHALIHHILQDRPLTRSERRIFLILLDDIYLSVKRYQHYGFHLCSCGEYFHEAVAKIKTGKQVGCPRCGAMKERKIWRDTCKCWDLIGEIVPILSPDESEGLVCVRNLDNLQHPWIPGHREKRGPMQGMVLTAKTQMIHLRMLTATADEYLRSWLLLVDEMRRRMVPLKCRTFSILIKKMWPELPVKFRWAMRDEKLWEPLIKELRQTGVDNWKEPEKKARNRKKPKRAIEPPLSLHVADEKETPNHLD
jgi:hypothetical protein